MIPSSGCQPWPPDIRPILPESTRTSRSYTTLRDAIRDRRVMSASDFTESDIAAIERATHTE